MTEMPPEVCDLAAGYLDKVDRALPGFVEGLYITGSTALGAWQAGPSDIDTLIMTSRPAGADDLAALARVHANLPAQPHFDGIYLDRATFVTQPADRRVVPFVVNGEFRTDKQCGDLNPVVWLILQRYGIAVRGPAVAELGLSIDHDALHEYNLDNLRTYWQPLADDVRGHLRGMADDAPVDGEGVVWLMTGPIRLHFTLAFADVVSKPGSAAYLTELFPAWAELAQRANVWRSGVEVLFTAKDLSDAVDSSDAIVADACERYATAYATADAQR